MGSLVLDMLDLPRRTGLAGQRQAQCAMGSIRHRVAPASGAERLSGCGGGTRCLDAGLAGSSGRALVPAVGGVAALVAWSDGPVAASLVREDPSGAATSGRLDPSRFRHGHRRPDGR